MPRYNFLASTPIPMLSPEKRQQSSSIRMEKIQRDITRALSSKLLELTRDGYLAETSISHVKLSRDIGNADIYLLPLYEADGAQVLQKLQARRQMLRAHLARSLNLQRVPKLKFRLDTIGLEQERVAQLLNNLNKQ